MVDAETGVKFAIGRKDSYVQRPQTVEARQIQKRAPKCTVFISSTPYKRETPLPGNAINVNAKKRKPI